MRSLTDNPVLFLVVLLALPSSLYAQDELQDFFGEGRTTPSKEQQDDIRALWRKAQIGAREDRLAVRSQLVEYGGAALQFLESKLGTGSVADVRTASLVLGRSGDAAVAEELRLLLFKNDKTAAARRHLALALGLLGGTNDVPHALEQLTGNRRNDYRRALVHALGALGDRRAVPVLIKEYGRDNAQQFRRAVLLALGRIGGVEAVAQLKKAMRSKKESIRRSAVVAAADLRDKAFLDDFRRLLKDSDDRVVKHALIALSLIKDPAIGPAIKKAGSLRIGESETRALAVLALGMQDDGMSLGLLKARAKSKLERNLLVRRALAFALGRRPAAMTKAIRKKFLQDRDPEVGRALWCATALSEQQSSGVLIEQAIFNKGLHDRVRLTLLELLALHDPEHAVPVFKQIAEERRFKKKVLARSAELLEILQRPGQGVRELMRARVQVEIDDLGGSPEWHLLEALHHEFLEIENIARPLATPGVRTQPGVPQIRKPDPWTNEDEDLRLWFDRYHFYDRRHGLDVRI